jgi:hypothetical protein
MESELEGVEHDLGGRTDKLAIDSGVVIRGSFEERRDKGLASYLTVPL